MSMADFRCKCGWEGIREDLVLGITRKDGRKTWDLVCPNCRRIMGGNWEWTDWYCDEIEKKRE
jgi:hypothetical protein